MTTPKRHRRYREPCSPNQITVSVRKGERVHDFFKGWGTLCKDGSILWDYWRPPTKRQVTRFNKRSNFDKLIFPMIKKVSPELLSSTLISVQPLGQAAT